MIASSQERFPGACEKLQLPGPGCSSETSTVQMVDVQKYTTLLSSGHWAVASRSSSSLPRHRCPAGAIPLVRTNRTQATRTTVNIQIFGSYLISAIFGHNFPNNCGSQHGWKNSFRFQAGLEPGTLCFSIMVLDQPTMPACTRLTWMQLMGFRSLTTWWWV